MLGSSSPLNKTRYRSFRVRWADAGSQGDGTGFSTRCSLKDQLGSADWTSARVSGQLADAQERVIGNTQ